MNYIEYIGKANFFLQKRINAYLVVYDSDDYVLGFPLTTKNKKLNHTHRTKIQL